MAWQLTRNEQDAHDLVQDTFLKAWNSYDNFKPGTNCRAWLRRILKNTFISNYRRRAIDRRAMQEQRCGSCTMVDRDSIERYSNPEQVLAFSSIPAEVEEALDALPDIFRTAVVQSDVHGHSYRQIAETIGTPVGTVMSRLFRARRLLRASLHDFAAREGYLPTAAA